MYKHQLPLHPTDISPLILQMLIINNEGGDANRGAHDVDERAAVQMKTCDVMLLMDPLGQRSGPLGILSILIPPDVVVVQYLGYTCDSHLIGTPI